ncbi:MFS transporter [Alkalibacillus haloalkaliphilus]|uniref:MFS transporter n=1 Tax=Alkalibacillus haloalkaliphilus TaxID=94136 RepID=A0A511W0K6_9BACI|nr:MFS transporter [Alkalibacillus haloalkaliphilus]GEN44620.1 MFS transporter [Alkalibacillus haloalkaliphilus]
MYLNALKNRNALFYILSAGITNAGNVISGMAFLFLAYELTQSNLYTTGIAISQVLPYLFFGLIGGVVSDWIQKRRLLIIFDLIRVPLIFSLVFFFYFGLLEYWHLIVVSFLIQLLGCFYNPAHRALLPIIVPVENRTAINSLLDSVTRGATVLGPIISIVLINTVGIIHFFTIDAVTFLISALLISKITLKEDEKGLAGKSIKDVFLTLKSFVIWANQQTQLKTLFIVTFIMVFLNTWVWQVGLLLQLSATLSNAEEWYSIILGTFGVCVILVNIIVPYVWEQLNLKHYLIASSVWSMGIFTIGLAFALPIYFIGALIVAMGLPISSLARVYLLQLLLPNDMLGKGFSFNAFLLYLSNAISLGVFGLLSTFVSINIIFVVCGLLMILAGLVSYYLTILRK